MTSCSVTKNWSHSGASYNLTIEHYSEYRRRWKQAEKIDLPCEHVWKRKEHWQFWLDSQANHLKSNRKGNAPCEHEPYKFTDPIDSLQQNFL